MDSMETKKKLTTILIHVILIIVSITMLVPFIWMILTAFKTVTEATSVDPFTIFPKIWRKDAFISVINNMNFLLLYKNTLLLIFFRVVCAVLTATMAGYAFGRLNFKGRDLCFSLVLFQMMVPVQIFIIRSTDGQQDGYAEYDLCPCIPRYGHCVRYFPSETGIHGTAEGSGGGCQT